MIELLGEISVIMLIPVLLAGAFIAAEWEGFKRKSVERIEDAIERERAWIEWKGDADKLLNEAYHAARARKMSCARSILVEAIDGVHREILDEDNVIRVMRLRNHGINRVIAMIKRHQRIYGGE